MHVLSLGISKMLKECMIKILGNQHRISTSMKSLRGHSKAYSQIKNHAPSCQNIFVKDAGTLLSGGGVRSDFSNGQKSSFMSGLFTKNGMFAMLDASHLDSVDLIKSHFSLDLIWTSCVAMSPAQTSQGSSLCMLIFVCFCKKKTLLVLV